MKNRREFIKSMGRGVLLTSLVSMGGYLLLRENQEHIENCHFDFICSNCKNLSKCDLPEAKDYKSNSPTL